MYREKIEKYIEDNRGLLVENIKRLVRIPSTREDPLPGKPFGAGPDAALTEALEIGKELGFKTTNYDGYVGTLDFSDAPACLDILAHLDIVPAPPQEWTVTQPFEPLEKDGKIYGRGASDNKGPAIASMLAMKAVKDLNIPLKKNVRLILGTDEESGSSDVEYYYSKEDVAPMTFAPDANFPVINTEKGRFSGTINASYSVATQLPKLNRISAGSTINVIPDHATMEVQGLSLDQINEVAVKWAEEKAVILTLSESGDIVTINIKGVGGHAAEPETARNAATAVIDLATKLPFAKSEGIEKLKELAKLFPHGDWYGKAAGVAMEDDISGKLTISLNVIDYSDTKFYARFDSRTALCATKETTVDIVKSKCTSAGLDLSEYSTNEAHHVPEDSDFIKTLLKVYEDYSGNVGECLSFGGTTYVHGLPNAVAFGATLPGTMGNIHGADEFVVIDELLLSAKIFTQVIIDLCS